MTQVTRRVGIAVGASVIAWFAAVLVGVWLYGSANFLAWVIAAFVGVAAYLGILWRDRRVG